MVSARGFLHIDARSGEFPDRLWGVADEPRPLAVQIWDNDPAKLAAVGRRLVEEFRVSVVDINFGCPVRDVSEKAQSGSYLLRYPDRVGQIVAQRGGRLPARAGDGQDPPGLHPRHDQRHRRGPGGRSGRRRGGDGPRPDGRRPVSRLGRLGRNRPDQAAPEPDSAGRQRRSEDAGRRWSRPSPATGSTA